MSLLFQTIGEEPIWNSLILEAATGCLEHTHPHTLKASIDLFYAALVHFPYDPSTSSKMLPCVRRAVLPLHWAHRSLFASSITLGEKKMKKVGCVCVCTVKGGWKPNGLTSADSLCSYFSNLKS